MVEENEKSSPDLIAELAEPSGERIDSRRVGISFFKVAAEEAEEEKILQHVFETGEGGTLFPCGRTAEVEAGGVLTWPYYRLSSSKWWPLIWFHARRG